MDEYPDSRRSFLQASGLLLAGGLLATEATAQAPKSKVRKDLGKLDVDSPDIKALAKAYSEMKKISQMDPNHPHGWVYQANIHGVRPANNTGPDDVWNQCQHGNWWFFPWHRMYIYFFERIVRKYSGYDDFALPYWYWDKPDGSQLVLHNAFLPGGPLYIEARSDAANSGQPIDDNDFIQTDKQRAMSEKRFVVGPNQPGFGGPFSKKPVHFNNLHGLLEGDGHDEIHVATGGDGAGDDKAWMSKPLLAARDPIFWVHHSNIDRLWIEWLRMGGGRENPSEQNPAYKPWFETDFAFYDENKKKVTMTAKDVLDTTKLDFGYVYDMFPDFRVAKAGRKGANMREEQPSTVAEFSKPGQELGAEPFRTAFKLSPKARAGLAATAKEEAGYAQLTLHGVKFSNGPDSVVRVYLNLPKEATPPGAKDPRYAGSFTFFVHEHDHEKGMTVLLSITTTVRTLQKKEGMWKKDELTITLVRTVPSGRKKFKSKLTLDKLTLEVGEAE